ncbi:hypothetical protein GCM10010495_69270 [Kitasatospora herbaricolor]|nr:hypothetical protein GCM10010495_69270 [Kitasatospora herbaricolor]
MRDGPARALAPHRVRPGEAGADRTGRQADRRGQHGEVAGAVEDGQEQQVPGGGGQVADAGEEGTRVRKRDRRRPAERQDGRRDAPGAGWSWRGA